MSLQQHIQVRLDPLRQVSLEQRSPLQLPALAAITGPFELDDQACIDGVLTGFSELELVLPLERVETPTVRSLPIRLCIGFSEPERIDAVTQAEGRGAAPCAVTRFTVPNLKSISRSPGSTMGVKT